MSSVTAPGGFMTSITRQRQMGVAVRLVIAVILIIFSVFPVLWILSSAFNPANSLASAKLIPDNAGWDNFYILYPADAAFARF